MLRPLASLIANSINNSKPWNEGTLSERTPLQIDNPLITDSNTPIARMEAFGLYLETILTILPSSVNAIIQLVFTSKLNYTAAAANASTSSTY